MKSPISSGLNVVKKYTSFNFINVEFTLFSFVLYDLVWITDVLFLYCLLI